MYEARDWAAASCKAEVLPDCILPQGARSWPCWSSVQILIMPLRFLGLSVPICKLETTANPASSQTGSEAKDSRWWVHLSYHRTLPNDPGKSFLTPCRFEESADFQVQGCLAGFTTPAFSPHHSSTFLCI